jgi:hypothetical protein
MHCAFSGPAVYRDRHPRAREACGDSDADSEQCRTKTGRSLDDRSLSGRDDSRRVKDCTAAVQWAEEEALERMGAGRHEIQGWTIGPPRPECDPPVKDSGRHRRCCGLPGTPGSRARSQGRLEWLRSLTKVVDQGIEQRRRTRALGSRSDPVVATGPGRDWRAQALSYEEQEHPGPERRQWIKVSSSHLDHNNDRASLPHEEGPCGQ